MGHVLRTKCILQYTTCLLNCYSKSSINKILDFNQMDIISVLIQFIVP